MAKRKVVDYDNNRFRSWTLVLYSDSKSYDFDSVLQVLKSFKDYAYIKHQPDDGIKKVHYHFNLFLDNPTYRRTLAKKLGIPETYIESIDNIRVMNRYLTHIDYEDKQKYDLSCCVVSSHYYKRFKKCYDDLETENTIINRIFFKIDDLISNSRYDYFTIQRELLLWVSDECYENIYKKYRYEFLDYLKGKL